MPRAAARGDDEREAPAVLLAEAGVAHAGVDGDHEHLRDAAAEVAPARRGGVGRADDVVGEHARGPVLRDDEGGAAEADAGADLL